MLDTSRPAVALCMQGTQAEFEGAVDYARLAYKDAWAVAHDDYDRCIAAHYIAHLEVDPDERLRWNMVALEHAQKAPAALVEPFFGSLYVNLGESYESIGDAEQAAHFYALAAEHGVTHQPG